MPQMMSSRYEDDAGRWAATWIQWGERVLFARYRRLS